jgi:hypothetical protein
MKIESSKKYLEFVKDSIAVEKALAKAVDEKNSESLFVGDLSDLPFEEILPKSKADALAEQLFLAGPKSLNFQFQIEGDDSESIMGEMGALLGRAVVKEQPPSESKKDKAQAKVEYPSYVDPLYFGVRTGTGAVFGGMTGYGVGVLIRALGDSTGNPYLSPVAGALAIIGAGLGGLGGSGVLVKVTGENDKASVEFFPMPTNQRFGWAGSTNPS